MSHVSRQISKYFQMCEDGPEFSVRHERDMARRKPGKLSLSDEFLDTRRKRGDLGLFDEYLGDTEREKPEPGSVVSLRQFCHQRLIELEEPACAGGIGLAIAEAVSLCACCQVPPPLWLAEAVAKLANDRMDDAERRNRRDLTLHKTRWAAVRQVMKLRAPASVEDCCAEVSEAFADSPLAGGDDAIRASYYLIEESSGDLTTLESYQRARQRRRA
jgi:hypothetical protein